MSTTHANKIDILKAATSKKWSRFWKLKLRIGLHRSFIKCDFINGEWQKPVIKPYAPFLLDPSARVFHYGQAIFEGMKAYKDRKWWRLAFFALMKITNDSTIQHSEWQCRGSWNYFVWLNGIITKIDQAWIKKEKIHCTSDHFTY
jgi:branched-chain amino acid aminotransferase